MAEDPWKVLGVPRGAPLPVVRDAYDRLVERYPPDTAPDDFARIHIAFGRAMGNEPPPWLPPPLPQLGGDGLYEQLVAHLDAGDYDAIWREVATIPIKDAATAAVVLRASGVLAWREPLAVNRIYSITPLARSLGETALAAGAENETILATRFRYIWGTGASPLVALFGDHLLASPERRRAVVSEVGALLDDWSRLLAFCDQVQLRDQPLTVVLTQRLQRESPLWGDRALAPLAPALREELGRRLEAIRDPTRVRRYAVGAMAGAASVALTVLTLVPTFAVYGLGLTTGAVVGSPSKRYRKFIRPRLAPIIAELGVQADTVSAWARAYPKRSRKLRALRFQIESDPAMALLGAIAALVRERDPGRFTAPAIAAYR